jgi:hypothetical protein
MPKLQIHVTDDHGVNLTPLDIPINNDLALLLHAAIAKADASDMLPNDGILEMPQVLNASVKVFGLKIPIKDNLVISLGVAE